eukprot:TRINITY_DN9408_c0_g1_i1.p1 TRINITY_DN9408_c0_g1~~TRINITY_DN9408_c0_g1_i1.p1  ORF type:complete len:402 (+),score=53.22 TRINITY_DN9408_c0_g1_i1:249-1454(+)
MTPYKFPSGVGVRCSVIFFILSIFEAELVGAVSSFDRYGQYQPIIGISPYINAQVGDDVVLECKLNPQVLDKYQDVQLYWVFSNHASLEEKVIYSVPWTIQDDNTIDGQQIAGGRQHGLRGGEQLVRSQGDGTKVVLSRNMFQLYLSRIRDQQEGRYVCQVSIGDMEAVKDVFVNVKKPQRAKVENGEVVSYAVDQNVKLLCVDMENRNKGEVSGNVVWRKNGKIVAENPELKLIRVDKEDEGEYHCIVSGSIHRNVTIKVEKSPKVEVVSSVVYQHPGYPARLECSVQSSQVPIISWFKEEIEERGNHTVKELNPITDKPFLNEFQDFGITSILDIENVSLSSYGLYTCNASNQLGQDSAEVVLVYSSTPVFATAAGASPHVLCTNLNVFFIILIALSHY